ncbi:MAG: chromate efflux transporter [Rhodobacteraceae bacterium]|nr:chromate efflux transporter [Paracoccaceae bacterium]
MNRPPAPAWPELRRTFGRIGLLSFGGPAAQIALMHRELVAERGWLSEREFLSALSFCMLLPGPEAMQLATYAGWRLRGVPGGLLAGGLFVLPGAALVLALAASYASLGDVPLVRALFTGVQAAVVVIVIEALIRLSRRALVSPAAKAIALLAFLAIFAFGVPFPAILLAAALAGALLLPRAAPEAGGPAPAGARPASTAFTVALWAALWLVPLAALVRLDGGLLAEVALFFSKLAVVTFGGAYAVLAYMTQEVVEGYRWLTAAEMIDGLGLAETTPGPLILVTEFVGYLAGHRAGGPALGLAAAAVTLWMTFVPCFLWVFAGAPWIGALVARPRLAAALAGVTAAVAGVILNLSLWFAAHAFFAEVGRFETGPLSVIAPEPAALRPLPLGIAAVAAVLLLRFRWPLPLVLAVAAALGGLGAAPG